MTGKADFTEQEWELVVAGPATAGLVVITAQRGGMMRETVAMAKAYAEARQQHGQSQLIDEIVAAKPKADHSHHGSFAELEQHGLDLLRQAVALLEHKATAEELDGYRRFTLTVTDKVAKRHKEDGVDVSEAEQAAIDHITTALGGPGSG